MLVENFLIDLEKLIIINAKLSYSRNVYS